MKDDFGEFGHCVYMNGPLCARFRVCYDRVGCSSTFVVAAIYAAGPYEIR